MKGYYEGYSYVGFMPDGSERRFATENEYREAFAEEAASLRFFGIGSVYKVQEKNIGCFWIFISDDFQIFKSDPKIRPFED